MEALESSAEFPNVAPTIVVGANATQVIQIGRPFGLARFYGMDGGVLLQAKL